MKITPRKENSQGSIQVCFDIKNTGKLAGDEVPQLYIHEEVTDVTT